MSGVFFKDKTITEQNDPKVYQAMIDKYVQECREMTKDVPNENFPEYIWTVTCNNFEGDNYKILGSITDLEVLKVYKIGTKYNSIDSYLEAISIYNYYMKYLDETYNDPIEKIALSANIQSTVYIPREPRLTHKKALRKFMSTGVIPSKRRSENIVPDHIFESYLEDLDIEMERETMTSPKWERKARERMGDSLNRKNRAGHIFSASQNEEFDAIISFLTSGDSSGKVMSSHNTITDDIEEIRKWDCVPQEIIDVLRTPISTKVVNGTMVASNSADNILIKLAENGYSVMENGAALGASKNAVKAYRQTSRPLEAMTPKELKKLKKKQHLERKSKMERQKADSRLQGFLSNSKHVSVMEDDPVVTNWGYKLKEFL